MSNYIKNGVFNHQKWQRTLHEGPGNDALLKSIRTRIPGEKFPELNTWWEYEPEDIMTYVYWHQGQLPPTGPKFDKEWTNIVKQLHSKHPIPADVLPHVDLDKQSMDAIMHDMPTAENIKDLTLNEATVTFKPGDMYSDDFDYVGMLQWGVDANAETMDKDELEAGYASFEDVNYHREVGALGNAIDSMEGAVTEREWNKVEDFMSDFNSACAKTLKDIERR